MNSLEYSELKILIQNLESDIAKNLESTKKLQDSTTEIIELFQAFKGAARILNLIAAFAKPFMWIMSVGTLISGFFLAMKSLGK
jgi:hypothetical protein